MTSPAHLWGVVPVSKLVDAPSTLAILDPDERAATASAVTSAVAGNRWVEALRHLGHEVRVSDASIPVEEGETSLNASLHQALASLLPCAAAGSGNGPTVLGNVVFGNHALMHSLAGLAAGCAAPQAALGALIRAVAGTGPEALVDEYLERPAMKRVRGELARRSFLRERRILRFPATLFAAPAPDALRRLAGALDWGPWITRTLLHVREATAGVGLASYADFMLVARAVLIREFAAMVEVDAATQVPLSFEHLVGSTTDDSAGLSLHAWVADHHQGLRACLARRHARVSPRGSGTYRVLNYFVPEGLIGESARSIAGRQSEHGWHTLRAHFSDGTIAADPAGMAHQPVRALLREGFGLSGKLVYHAVCAVNRRRVCNLIFQSSPDVFSALADEAEPNRIMALRRVRFRAAWQHDDRGIDLIAGMNWIHRCAEPRHAAARLFRDFRRLATQPTEPKRVLALE